MLSAQTVSDDVRLLQPRVAVVSVVRNRSDLSRDCQKMIRMLMFFCRSSFRLSKNDLVRKMQKIILFFCRITDATRDTKAQYARRDTRGRCLMHLAVNPTSVKHLPP